MIKVSVMYPNSSNATFDIDYYCDIPNYTNTQPQIQISEVKL